MDTPTDRARALLAETYRDNGDLGSANYVAAGHDITPDTQIALLAIVTAIEEERERCAKVVDRAAGPDGYGNPGVDCRTNRACVEALGLTATAIREVRHG